MYAVGIDGCSNGWLASYSKPFDFENCFCLYSKSLDELISKLPERNLIIVDIPIGLEEKKHIRECDIKAREFIGPRRHSIFAPPCKKASLQNDYASANKLNKEITSYGLSKQTWMINEKLKETQKLIEKGYLLYEGHPECSFRKLKGDFLKFGKSGLLGFFERLNLVTNLGFDPISLRKQLSHDIKAKPDDLLDSLILCWSASRHIEKKGIYLGLNKKSKKLSDKNKSLILV
jgi:predicted RNase H-like nuclease